MQEVEDYLRFVGRLHDVAGVDPRFLDITGLAFCHALDVLDQKGFHGDIWNSQVKGKALHLCVNSQHLGI